MHKPDSNREDAVREVRAVLVRGGSSFAKFARDYGVTPGHFRRVLLLQRQCSIRMFRALSKLMGPGAAALVGLRNMREQDTEDV